MLIILCYFIAKKYNQYIIKLELSNYLFEFPELKNLSTNN